MIGKISIAGLFDAAPGSSLEGYAVEWMRLLGLGMPIVGTHIALVGLLQGAGATRISLRINVWATLAFQIPVSFILGFVFDLGATGVWLGFPLAFVVKAGLAYAAVKSDRWANVGKEVRA